MGLTPKAEQEKALKVVGIPDLGIWGVDLLVRNNIESIKKAEVLLLELPEETFLFNSFDNGKWAVQRLTFLHFF